MFPADFCHTHQPLPHFSLRARRDAGPQVLFFDAPEKQPALRSLHEPGRAVFAAGKFYEHQHFWETQDRKSV